QASFDFMKAHSAKFDDHLVRECRDAACGLPPGGAATKVHSGEVGGEAEIIGPAVRAAFDLRWSETMEAEHGLKHYAALLDALADPA
ncbi:MAG TPA: sulfotransferase, partial [Roseovarius nubinhibens]|nr:sulfotransferase [Roseovarius nubinhibens]